MCFFAMPPMNPRVQIAQHVDRKDYVDIFVSVAMIVVMMRDHQVPGIYVGQNLTIS